MDLCATAVAAGAAWVHRSSAFDPDLADVIATAIEQPGFAMVDILELCTAYYVPRNKLGKKDLLALLDERGPRRGLHADRPRPEYSARYREAYQAGRHVLSEKPLIQRAYPNAVRRQTGIIIAGSAGQKVRSTATLFAEGSIFAGLNATQKDDYPITVQTGHSVSEIIVSPERIDYTGIDFPDFFVLLSVEGLARSRARIETLLPACTLFAEQTLELPVTDARVLRLPLAELGRRVGRPYVAAAALAALLEDSGIFPKEAFAAAINAFRSGETTGRILRAVGAGAELVRLDG
jgi:Pyruvate/2-oxoacid:ferredoxin oxidoreductase gamma subunit